MTWFKVDDKHHDHRKTRKALKGPGKRRDATAIGLWCLAGSWSADNLMDGFVPTDELLRWDDDAEALAQRLVDADLWEPSSLDDEPGFQFINWDEHQPTKADVEAKREAARERMRSVRAKGGRGSGEVRANEQANSARSSHSVRSTPSRPVPSRPDQEQKAESDDSEPPARSLALVNDHRPDVDHICDHLAEAVESTGAKRPSVTAKWRTEARLMLDRDGRTVAEVDACIRWLYGSTHKDALFWRPNVRAMPKLRAEYDRLLALSQRRMTSSRGPDLDTAMQRALAKEAQMRGEGA